MNRCYLLTTALLLGSLLTNSLAAQSSSSLRDLDTHCPFTPPASLEAWQPRAAALKLQLQMSMGMLPGVELDAVQPAIYGKIQRDGYSIEKVTFESLPGFYVTGNLYRPAELPAASRVPAVLCPHGHWNDARFYEASEAQVDQLLAIGAERFENAARNHIQARCVQLARMGCIVFHWDMIGYCDSQQISYDRAHRFANQPLEDEVNDDGWLLFSPLAESHCQSVLGLQTLAIQRAVDMLLTLPEVDPDRIGITGASGGGTQSFIGAALDERIDVAFPAVMVSTGMQGGCTCENACWLRTGTGNIEMAALIAPRPLGLTAANDWTKTMPQDGFPELQALYGLFDAKQKVALFPAVHFDHNFNHVARVSMYGWMSDHFGLGQKKPILERDFELTSGDALTVWDDEHPQPEGGEQFERKLMKLWADIVDSQMRGWLAGDRQQLQQLADTLRGGWQVCLGLTSAQLGELRVKGELASAEVLQLQADQLPAWSLRSALLTEQAADRAQPVVSNAGKGGAEEGGKTESDAAQSHDAILQAWQPSTDDLRLELSAGDGQPRLLYPVLAGQLAESGQQVRWQAIVKNPRLAACYTWGYNQPLFSQRAQQLGLTLEWLSAEHPGQTVTLHARGANAALAAAAAFVAQERARAAGRQPTAVVLKLQPGEFAFATVDHLRDPNFLPGSARYWGLPGLVACLSAAVEIEGGSGSAERYQPLIPLQQLAGGSLQL